MDPDLGRFQVVWAAAGTPTAVFPVPPATLRMLSNAHVAPICEERRAADVLAERSDPGAGAPVGGSLGATPKTGAAGAWRHPPHVAVEPRHAIIAFPGGFARASAGRAPGSADAVFALTQAGGPLVDHGELVGPDPDARCRAEIRVETPAGPWTVRLASTISDEPAGLLWDTEGLLVIKYGFHVYAFEARTGELRWSHRSASPVLVVIGSSRLAHVLVQAEVETFALEADGEVAWRVAHSDVVTEAELVGGRLVLDELRRPGARDRSAHRAGRRLGRAFVDVAWSRDPRGCRRWITGG